MSFHANQPVSAFVQHPVIEEGPDYYMGIHNHPQYRSYELRRDGPASCGRSANPLIARVLPSYVAALFNIRISQDIARGLKKPQADAQHLRRRIGTWGDPKSLPEQSVSAGDFRVNSEGAV